MKSRDNSRNDEFNFGTALVQYYPGLYHVPLFQMQARTWCFTVFPSEEADKEDALNPELWSHMRYCIFQLELSESGRLHYQGYVEFGQPKRLNALKKMEGLEGAHFEPRKGTRDQARAYCKKLETRVDGPFEFGDWLAGTTDKIDHFAMKELIKEGKSDREIFEDHPHFYLRYHQVLPKIRSMYAEARDNKTHVTLIYGPPGCGKTKLAKEMCPTAYWKQPQTKWWDGYNGTDDIVIDDFKGWLTYTQLLRILDRYPLMVEVKGSNLNFNPRRLVITCSTLPWTWYSNDVPFKWHEFARRVDKFLGNVDDQFQEFQETEFFNSFSVSNNFQLYSSPRDYS